MVTKVESIMKFYIFVFSLCMTFNVFSCWKAPQKFFAYKLHRPIQDLDTVEMEPLNNHPYQLLVNPDEDLTFPKPATGSIYQSSMKISASVGQKLVQSIKSCFPYCLKPEPEDVGFASGDDVL
jgi:hypothetical protein